MSDGPQKRIHDALYIAEEYGGYDGAHHKAWVIDQMVRALTGGGVEPARVTDEYRKWRAEYEDGPDGPQTYEWDEGVMP